ncbi:MAG: hypothetical protein WHT84_12565 [Breznakiellaceae bacterium]
MGREFPEVFGDSGSTDDTQSASVCAFMGKKAQDCNFVGINISRTLTLTRISPQWGDDGIKRYLPEEADEVASRQGFGDNFSLGKRATLQ